MIPKHVLRALLRECTYLPDPASRQYMKSHILNRWRSFHSRNLLDELRRQKGLREAQKTLRALNNANNGLARPLKRILLMTYGRVGKRRHELLKPLKTESSISYQDERGVSVSSDFIAISLKNLSVHLSVKAKLPKMNPQLLSLLRSQARGRGSVQTSRAYRLKGVQLDIPAKNIWQLPMPQKRIKNAVKKWYGNLLAKTLPPLPEDEWTRLKDLAHGTSTSRFHPISRRSEGAVSTQEKESSPSLSRELGLARRQTRPSLPRYHSITPRVMQRLWLYVFQMCPVMRWDLFNKRWVVEWGNESIRWAKSNGSEDGADGGLMAEVKATEESILRG